MGRRPIGCILLDLPDLPTVPTLPNLPTQALSHPVTRRGCVSHRVTATVPRDPVDPLPAEGQVNIASWLMRRTQVSKFNDLCTCTYGHCFASYAVRPPICSKKECFPEDGCHCGGRCGNELICGKEKYQSFY